MVISVVMWVVTGAAIIGTIANTRQKRWCFPVWAVTNAAQAVYCLSKGALPTAALMAVYFGLAIYGWFAWGRKEES